MIADLDFAIPRNDFDRRNAVTKQFVNHPRSRVFANAQAEISGFRSKSPDYIASFDIARLLSRGRCSIWSSARAACDLLVTDPK